MIVVMIIIHFSPAKLFLLTVGIAHMIMKYRKFALVICVPHVLNIMINGSYTSPDMNSECIFKNNLPILPEWLHQNASKWVNGNKLLFVLVITAQNKAIKLVSKEVRARSTSGILCSAFITFQCAMCFFVICHLR